MHRRQGGLAGWRNNRNLTGRPTATKTSSSKARPHTARRRKLCRSFARSGRFGFPSLRSESILIATIRVTAT